jgi:hypothetical protein
MEWCLDCDGGRYWEFTNNNPELKEWEEVDEILDQPFEKAPQFPIEIISSLLEAGADINDLISCRDVDGTVYFDIIALSMYSATCVG